MPLDELSSVVDPHNEGADCSSTPTLDLAAASIRRARVWQATVEAEARGASPSRAHLLDTSSTPAHSSAARPSSVPSVSSLPRSHRPNRNTFHAPGTLDPSQEAFLNGSFSGPDPDRFMT